MSALHPNDENEHVLSVAMELLTSGRATAKEVARLAGLPRRRVERWIDHDARGELLRTQWNAEMAKLRYRR